MDVVQGVDALRPEHGRLFVVIGVFDGIHRGHAYLLDHLRAQEQQTLAAEHGWDPNVKGEIVPDEE